MKSDKRNVEMTCEKEMNLVCSGLPSVIVSHQAVFPAIPIHQSSPHSRAFPYQRTKSSRNNKSNMLLVVSPLRPIVDSISLESIFETILHTKWQISVLHTGRVINHSFKNMHSRRKKRKMFSKEREQLVIEEECHRDERQQRKSSFFFFSTSTSLNGEQMFLDEKLEACTSSPTAQL
jgi:hypothetical protein